MEKREVILYCDLHGHSKKENIFMYGCDGGDRCKALYLQQRIFPLMLSKNCPDKVSTFKIFTLLHIVHVRQQIVLVSKLLYYLLILTDVYN